MHALWPAEVEPKLSNLLAKISLIGASDGGKSCHKEVSGFGPKSLLEAICCEQFAVFCSRQGMTNR
jgi:hypothetical protein